MPDIIQLLPDAVANQIAAGEVIQRPASVVKELVENAVDAGSTQIQVIIKDAGKTLIQVTDNGKGMSLTDARMSFERHATSKIANANDLFAINTKGFRGEALASIAAIAHVEMKTKQAIDQIGTSIIIEGSEVKQQEPTVCVNGTSFFIKNLFYNVPARRNFLKSDGIETSHIVDEFQRVALAHPEVGFKLTHNGNELYNLEKSPLRQRLINVFGKNMNEKLVPVQEGTDYVQINGFISKPEFARKTRGEQFFFINNRFVKNAYLNHAIVKAFENLLSTGTYPSYFIYFTVPPHTIDINIHPTKTEIKFEDEKTVYAILRSAIKRSLGIYNITPTIDFDIEQTVNISPLKPGQTVKAPSISVNPDYNPFLPIPKKDFKQFTSEKDWNIPDAKSFDFKSPERAHAELNQMAIVMPTEDDSSTESQSTLLDEKPQIGCFQLHASYIVCPIKTGFIIVDQHHAHERILYEKYIQQMAHHQAYSQQLLFPIMLEPANVESALLNGMLAEMHLLGFDIQVMGKNIFGVYGIPPDLKEHEVIGTIDNFLEEIKQSGELKTGKNEFIAKTMAHYAAIKYGEKLSHEEMQHIIDSLFSCELPYHNPSGKPTIITHTLEEIEKRFKR